MSGGLGSLKTDPLFLGLTRPAMILGVSFMFFVLNSLGCLMYFVMTSKFNVVIIGVAVHIFGMMLSKKEPLAVEILLTKLSKCGKCRNSQFHGGLNSYNMF